MHIKKNGAFIVTVLLSMLILAYITYATVYEQIISQNNGFFNMIIFGAVLILVFIFITLIARVIGLRPKTEESVITKYLVYILIMCIFAFFIFLRLKYTTSVPINESIPYKTADYLYVGHLSEGNDIMMPLIYYPSDFMYGVRIAVIFDLLGASKEAYYLMNIICMVISALFIFLTVNLVSNRVCAVIASLIVLFIPGNAFMVYSFNTEVFVDAYFYISVYLYCLLIFKRFKHTLPTVLLSIICGVVTGAVIWSEPVTLIAYLGLLLYLFKSEKQAVICKIGALIGTIGSFVFSLFAKVLQMKITISEAFSGFISCFNPLYNRNTAESVSIEDAITSLAKRLNNPSRFLSENFYFLSDIDGNYYSANQAIWLTLADQLVYIFCLILCVLCIVYLLRATYTKLMPLYTTMILLFIGQFLGGVNNVNYTYFTYLFIVIGASTIYYMYLNHHRDYATAVINNELKEDYEIKAYKEGTLIEDNEDKEAIEKISSNELLRARALIFIGENEALYEQIKESERKDRMHNPVAATQMYSAMSETGEYETKEQSIEYFDEMDNIQDKRPVNEVIAIPSSRPVEVVKPIFADDNIELDNNIIDRKKLEEINENIKNDLNLDTNSDIDISAINIPAEIEPITKPIDDVPVAEGFVFRKKDSTQVDTKPTKKVKSDKPVKEVKEEKVKKEKKVKEKPVKEKAVKAPKIERDKKLSKKEPKNYKPGEPIDNPLPLPKPHVNKDLDFDFDVDVNDDFDW